jgi:hypothetical protein
VLVAHLINTFRTVIYGQKLSVSNKSSNRWILLSY